MFCMKCGEVIPDGSSVCPKCGADLIEKVEGQAIVYASQKETETTAESKSIKKIPKTVLIGIVAIICVIVIAFIISGVNKANLKKELVKKWYDVDGSIIKVLDIDELSVALQKELCEPETVIQALSRLGKLLDLIYEDKFDTLSSHVDKWVESKVD